MLKIINNLRPFFEDCYRRISVREYAKVIDVSPPTASKTLTAYHAENLLLKTSYRNYILFYANKQNQTFIGLSRIYWGEKLHELVSLIEKKTINPTVVLFGSLSKAEAKPDSDVDLAVFATKKELNTSEPEGRIKRMVQIFWFRSIKDVKSAELANGIINGYLLKGRLKV